MEEWDEAGKRFTKLPGQPSIPIKTKNTGALVTQKIHVQSITGRAEVHVSSKDPLSLASRGIFAANPKTAGKSFTVNFLDLCTELSMVCAATQTDMQVVFAGKRTPDKDVYNEAFLQYRLHKHSAITRLCARLELDLPPAGCPACFQNPFMLCTGDACFKWRKQVYIHTHILSCQSSTTNLPQNNTHSSH